MSHQSAAPLARRLNRAAAPAPAVPTKTPRTIVVEFVRACGHPDRFEHPPDYKNAEGKTARLASKLCPSCREQKQRAQEAAQQAASGSSKKIKKGQEVKALPIGTIIGLRRQDDGSWAATISANGIDEEATSPGLMGLVTKAARKWLKASGRSLMGHVKP